MDDKEWQVPQNPDRACKVFTCKYPQGGHAFIQSNARQSKTFCDIVLVIDAYRLVQS